MKYVVEVTEGPICIAHQLNLPYQSKCNCVHGHNYHAKITVESYKLNPCFMVVDFTVIKQVLRKYDHTFLGKMHAFDYWVALLRKKMGLNFPLHELLGAFSESTPVLAYVDPSTAENFATVLIRELQTAVSASNTSATVTSVQLWETPGNSVTVFASSALETVRRALSDSEMVASNMEEFLR